ncbi:MAG TPA: cysteine desulfurase family protein [Acidimicrobiales bacterium]|nr:cysteine desulfurase family protein [Acidimicrobiales bacterium]
MDAPVAYLDHAATTPMRPEAVAAMLPHLAEEYGNPNGSHSVARRARIALEEARDTIAELVGCAPGEVVFTAGGTEADNTAIAGAVRRHGGRAVCPAAEHHAVLHVVEHLGGTIVGVDADSRVDRDQLAAALGDDVTVVSVMAVNNEVGSVTPLAEIAAVVREHAPRALLHTDAVQGFAWLDLATAAHDFDLLSLSAHKVGGPQGVGVLVQRRGAEVEPLLLGGGQEQDRRSGTQNVAGAVATATAMRITAEQREATVDRIGELRDRLVDGLAAELDGVVEVVSREARIAGSAHVCFEGVESEALLFLLDRAGVCASAASACASGAMDPSHVLAAMGVPKELAAGSIRFSLGWSTSDADIDHALTAVPAAVRKLRR